MDQVIEWHETPLDLESHKVLTHQQLNIPGLMTMGYYYNKKATPPLEIHFHKNCIEITYIVKGTVTFVIENTPYKLYGGDILITAPNVTHSTGNSPLGVCEIYWCQLDVSTPNTFLLLQAEWGHHLLSNLLQLGNCVIKQAVDLAPIIQASFDAFYQSNTFLAFNGVSFLIAFLHKLLQCQNSTPLPISFDIHHAIDYILSHTSEVIELEYLAALCHLSLSRFKQKFTTEMGISPREFINQQKIELAKTLLTENPNITDIALEIGFSSSSYFSVVFKRYTGMSPSEYIKHSR